MTIDAVIFDCDGTLVDSEPLGFESIIEEARSLGIVVTLDDDLLRLKGQSMKTCLAAVDARYREQFGLALPSRFEASLRQRMADVFRARLVPMPGALDMLNRLKIPFCVASNGPRAKIELTLGITDMLSLFEGRIFSAYEVGLFKPDPGLFLHAAAAMNVSPDRCAVVEDSAAGVLAGLAAGMQVFYLRSAQTLPEALSLRVTELDRLGQLEEALAANGVPSAVGSRSMNALNECRTPAPCPNSTSASRCRQ